MSFLNEKTNADLHKCINDLPDDERAMLNCWANSDSEDSEDEDDDDDEIEDLDANKQNTYEDLNDVNCDLNFMQDDNTVDSLFLGESGSVDPEAIFPFLPEEDVLIIQKCTDPDLSRLMLLNRAKKVHLKTLCSKYYKLLFECKRHLSIEMGKLDHLTLINVNCSLKTFAYPYFRDADKYHPPPNSDTLKKIENKEVNCNYLSKKVWSIVTQRKLKAVIELQIFNHHKEKIAIEIASCDRNKDKEKFSELSEHLKKLTKSKDHMEFPPPWGDSIIDWKNISTILYKDEEYEKTCRAFWNIYLHPEIYKGPFTASESEKIEELAEKYNYQNWEAILPELEHNRSPYLICTHYFSKLRKATFLEPFSFKEDQLLIELVESARVGGTIPWTNIQYHLHPRTKSQIYYRYKQLTESDRITKGQFTLNEDVLIQCLVKKFGENWSKISSEMPNRTRSQIIQRYKYYLKPNINLELGNWTIEEDKLILAHVKVHGAKNWKFLEKDSNRGVGHFRHRYQTIKKYLSKNPDISLDDLPRRSWRLVSGRLVREKSNKLAETYILNKTLPPIEPPNSDVCLNGRRPRQSVDEDLVNFFRTTARLRKSPNLRTVFEHNINNCVKTINQFFKILGFQLTIPSDDELKKFPLDMYDIEILKILRQKNVITYNTSDHRFDIPGPSLLEIEYDLPPNVNTIQALRCLILQYHSFVPTLPISLRNFESDVRPDLGTFEKRFIAMFRWPSLMSIIGPSENLIEKPPEITKKVYGKRGRPAKNLSKVLKMNAARRSYPVIVTQPSHLNIDLPSHLQPEPQDLIVRNTILTEELEEIVDDPEPVNESVVNAKITSINDVAQTIAKLSPKKNHKYIIKIGESTLQKLLKRKVNISDDNTSENVKLENTRIETNDDQRPGTSKIKKVKF